MKRLCFAAILLTPASASAGGVGEFSYFEPGDLIEGSGAGAADYTVYAPGMRYPLEVGPSFPNSQVWGHGGGSGPGGSQCDVENYSYPWRDNYCETRSWDMPLCPSGVGHQGQDIRPATCDPGVHWQVSSEAGTVTNVGSYSVYVTSAGGTRFDYLHGSGNVVSNGQALERGERINLADNEFGGTPTTYHLHFNIRQDVAGVGFVFVSPYMSLVESYKELLGIGGDVLGDAAIDECSAIVGWVHDENNPNESLTVQVYFDGAPTVLGSVGVEIVADEYRASLCDLLGSCEHGFTLEVPRSLRDGEEHQVKLFSLGSEDIAGVEIETETPPAFTCPPPMIPDGELRLLAGPEVVAAWGLSPFWDASPAENTVVDALPKGEAFPVEPVVVRAVGDDTLWWMDPGFKRRVESEAVLEAWGLGVDDVQEWPAHVLDDVVEGPPMRDEVFLLETPEGALYVVDAFPCDPEGCDVGGGTGGADSSTSGDAPQGTSTGAPDTDTDTDGAAADGGGDGCGCTAGAPSFGSAVLMLGLMFGFRRRRHSTVEAMSRQP